MLHVTFLNAGSILDNAANEFYVGFSENAEGISQSLRLFVIAAESDPVSFSVTATGFSFTGTATSDTSMVVNLPTSLAVTSSSERNKGIHIKAEGEKRIVIYGLNFHEFTTDAYLALPCSDLSVDEYEYYAITYPPITGFGLNSDILIVGCEDNTVITTPLTTFNLQKQETYLLRSLSDQTGVRVTTTKPVAFFSNSECSFIPAGVFACDHLTQQIPPTTTWGTSFFAASLLGRNSGERFRILAAEESTIVTVICTTFTEPVTHTLATAGSWEEFMISPLDFCYIKSSQRIIVVQFALGSALDSVGDPFMSMIPPVEQYSNNYVISAPPEFSTNFITLYVANEHYQPDRIFVDDTIPDISTWVAIDCSNSVPCGYITRVPLTLGAHRVFHQDADARLGVSSYGFNAFNSYGYPGGLLLAPVQCKHCL